MFALYDFRVFGNRGSKVNQKVKDFTAERDSINGNKVKLNWAKIPTAIGYNIRYGVVKDKMYMNRMVYSYTSLDINDLNYKSKYYFSIDVFNEAGVEKGKKFMS